jgi:hypothetical protein
LRSIIGEILIVHNTVMIFGKELLCVKATIRVFHSILISAELHVCTDHKNILNIGDSSEHVYMDLTCQCLPNAIVDTFSRLLCKDVTTTLARKKAAHIVSSSESDE